jgi:hypothetical protein
MVTKYFYAFSPVERYDVLVFKFPSIRRRTSSSGSWGCPTKRS